MTNRVVAHYELLEVLGSGAMGTVYKGRDLKLDREVAIKFISPQCAGDYRHKTRFINEAKAASMLDHQNICTIHEIEETDEGELFIVMAYCTGRTLRAVLDERQLELGEAIDIASQTAAGLQKAHSAGVVHRDIKPGNIMLADDGCVKIVDFGLAKVFEEEDATLTTAGTILGTVAYMSPEQVRGFPLDHRSDIWSWGVTFYEMISGCRPFEGHPGFDLAQAIVNDHPAPPSTLRSDIPPNIDHIVLQALQKDPRDRQQSGRELIDQLRLPSSATRAFAEVISERGIQESVAVLPFVNVQSDPDSDYFSDGLTEELINALSRVPNLRVVSRTSAFEFKGKAQNVSTIAQQLKVRTIVEGSVRKFRDRLRVTATLVSAANGYCLWSEKFDRTMTDVFEIQDEIAGSVAQALQVRLSPSSGITIQTPRTQNLEAYDAYLRGRFQWNKRSGEGLQQALACFEDALQLDPKYAPAYSGIADYHIAVGSWGLERPSEAWPKAKAAALRALDIDPNLAEAHASLGTVRMWCDWAWDEAEREFMNAISRNPGHPNARIQYNALLVQTGRFNEAEEQIRTVLKSDPLSIRANSYLAGVHHYRRDYDRSLEQAKRTLQLDPDDIELHVVLGLNYEQKGMYGEALQELEKARELSGNNPLILGPLGSCYAAAGETSRALAFLEELDHIGDSTYIAAITRAMIYLGMKDYDNAFAWIERAADSREVLLCYLGVGPIYDGIREDERYHKLMRQIGLRERRRFAA